MSLNCELIISSETEHLRQIYTGFSMLHRQNFLRLRQTIANEHLQNKQTADRWVDYKFFNAKVIINDKITVIYDAHDWNWIDEEILSEADFYFKRSYDEEFVSKLKEGAKVFPLGLNYQVASGERDEFQLQRVAFYGGKDKIKAIFKSFHFKSRGETEQLGNMQSYPSFDSPPKILFWSRAWDTNLIQNKNGREAVEQLNENRADCVRQLRKTFGKNFLGGLAHEDYAVKHFKDCLLPDTRLFAKRSYLEILKDFPICVTTVGLNGSNGWKLGEYVAFSKAIVTEPLHFSVTGDFRKEVNYLEFTTPENLVETAAKLFEDVNLRSAMMLNNYRYYQAFVKPDPLILNSLATVLSLA